MSQAAQDDAERQRNRARLYAPPPGVATRKRAGHGATAGISRSQAQSLMARLAAEDARLQSGGGAAG